MRPPEGGSHLAARGREVRRECGTHLRAGQEEGGAFMLSCSRQPPLKTAESSGSGRCGSRQSAGTSEQSESRWLKTHMRDQ